MPVYRVEIRARSGAGAADSSLLLAELRGAGLDDLEHVETSRLFLVGGAIDRSIAGHIAETLLCDVVTEQYDVSAEGDALPTPATDEVAFEVHPRPGVMDPVAESTLAELRKEGWAVDSVRTGRRYVLKMLRRDDQWITTGDRVAGVLRRVVANDCIEVLVAGAAPVGPPPQPPTYAFRLRHVPLRDLRDEELEALSRRAHLFLSLAEMRAIQRHFAHLGRDPTDLELETLAQTWSEHCVHKTLKSPVVYSGAPLPTVSRTTASSPPADSRETRRYGNLLRETIIQATRELMRLGHGPRCLSVFSDNAGVIELDADYGVAFKVETHNRPSAIEPYGGAATGIGGVIRDVLGCGLGAKPIASTDVFCVAPSDWPYDALPRGVLHPRRVLRGIVAGVADYGNRMGIPTVNGALYFDPRYLANPLVFCGNVGLIPRACIEKRPQPGDLVVVVGGRTGRDGIHGATFSSAELTDSHADEFSHAVQIGNAITEKRVLDAVLRARDAIGVTAGSSEAGQRCLYTAITDCGAGGLSSAVGEMGAEIGGTIDLERVPLKYAGLRYDEIWISEAQERMVLAVPPANLDPLMQIMREEQVEATVIGHFGRLVDSGPPQPSDRLIVRYEGHVVGELELAFLHGGVPLPERRATWEPPPGSAEANPSERAKRAAPSTPSRPNVAELLAHLPAELARPTVASKAWIIRAYDHEVQGGSAVKPLIGRGRGPGNAAVLRPRLDAWRGIALGCGLAPHLADTDPYWMAAAAIDEAVRNVVCVGGDPRRTAILDNFCWGRTDDPHQMGALVRACQACHDVALTYGTPFISGKDSLNNEFALDPADIEPLLTALREQASGDDADARRLRAVLPALESRVRARGRLAIPPTLLISALAIVDDVRRCVTSDLKSAGDAVLLVGGLPTLGFELPRAAAVHAAVAGLIAQGLVTACHDVSDGGALVALAEMAMGGQRGAALVEGPWLSRAGDEPVAAYLLETAQPDEVARGLDVAGAPCEHIAQVLDEPALVAGQIRAAIADLASAWSGAAG